MTIQAIPTDDLEPFSSQETTLDGVRYLLEFRYSQRENVWRLSISLADDGTELATGIKIVCNYPLLTGRADVRLPQGILIAVPNGSDASPPGLGELGESNRVALLYVPAAERADVLG